MLADIKTGQQNSRFRHRPPYLNRPKGARLEAFELLLCVSCGSLCLCQDAEEESKEKVFGSVLHYAPEIQRPLRGSVDGFDCA